MTVDEAIEHAAGIVEHNLALIRERGPGLYTDTKTYIAAKSPCGGFVMHGGLGGFGVGFHWTRTTEADRAHPMFAVAPIEEVDEAKAAERSMQAEMMAQRSVAAWGLMYDD